ncbi:hypothetical protein IV79_GL001431 [Pediococcus claussenii]|nr:hypothetical protein IV79_GL001431 [Pediococcus claussenii]
MQLMLYRYFIQPQINKYTNSIIGYELLIKGYENEGWRPPRYFADIPAEVIASVLTKTTEKLALKIGAVSVNLNRTQMMNRDIDEALMHAQDKLRPVRMVVELTEEPNDEGTTIADLVPILKSFSKRGIEISIDDVGTGENQVDRISGIVPYASEIKFALQNFDQPFSDSELQDKVKFWYNFAEKNKLRFILEGIEDQQDD